MIGLYLKHNSISVEMAQVPVYVSNFVIRTGWHGIKKTSIILDMGTHSTDENPQVEGMDDKWLGWLSMVVLGAERFLGIRWWWSRGLLGDEHVTLIKGQLEVII